MATLDVLSAGRAVFGVGLGYSAHEFEAFGV
jgi:alkanesulfonate monooxygenase SsuD/methylene tetrahydromethanopterin reductase-like flavin-dependent oxidoreductase (luciferase family)